MNTPDTSSLRDTERETVKMCAGRVWPSGSWRGQACSRKGTVTRDGESYCHQHDPEAVKARNAAREVRWSKERAVQDAAWQVEKAEREVCALVRFGSNDAARMRRTLAKADDALKTAKHALSPTEPDES